MTQLWTEKYFPSSFESLVGNSEIAREVSNWGLEWNRTGKGKPLLFFGPSGCGKTALALLAAKSFGWSVFELNASDIRTKDVVERVVSAAAANSSFSGARRLVLLDEIDGLQARADRGGMSAVLAVLKEAKNPVILTANDIYDNKQMAEIRNFCRKLEFKKPNYLSVVSRLREICELEGIDFDLESLKALSKSASGDIRSALLDLQSLSAVSKKVTLQDVNESGFRDRPDKIFSTMQRIFRSQTSSESARARFSSEASPDFLARWVEENLPLEFSDSSEHASAWNRLSRSDVFSGRIRRRQHYGFLRYSLELMTLGVALAHTKPKHEFIMYRFPQLLRFLSSASSARAMKKALGKKIGKRMHSSSNAFASKDLAYWKVFFESKPLAVRLSASFDLSEGEIAFLMQSDADSKKVLEVFEKSRVLARALRLAPHAEPDASDETDSSSPELVRDSKPVDDSRHQTRLF